MPNPHAEFCWNELMTRDMEGAKAFYGAVMGWTFKAFDDAGTYWVAYKGYAPVAGLFKMDGSAFEGIPPHWFAYIACNDVDASVKAAAEAGAEVLRPPFEAASYRMAILRDAVGAVIGFSQEMPESG